MTLTQFILININLVVLYLLYILLLRKNGHTTFNRFFLLLAPAIAIALPFLPATGTESPVTWTQILNEITIGTANTAESSLNIDWPTIIYTSGVSFAVLILVYRFMRVMQHPPSRFVNKYKGANVYILENDASSYSFFNRIYINESQLAESEVILFHESAHCQEKHSLDILILSIYQSILWFNPIIFLYGKSMKENHEFIADKHVLEQGIDIQQYGTAMLSASFNCAIPTISNGFNAKSLLLKRIEHLKHTNQFNMKHVVILPILAGLIWSTTSLTLPSASNEPDGDKSEIVKGEPDTQPEYKGGQEAMFKFIVGEIKYPKEMARQNIEGKVYVGFDVTAKGKIENVNIKRSSGHADLDAEAMRVIGKMPNWNPGMKDGKVVKSQMQLPIVFKLDNKPPKPPKPPKPAKDH